MKDRAFGAHPKFSREKISINLLFFWCGGKAVRSFKTLCLKTKFPIQSEFPSQFGDIMDDNQYYFLSRGQGHHRHPAPAQKIRDLLKSSLDKRQNFQPRAVMQFLIGQEIAQVG